MTDAPGIRTVLATEFLPSTHGFAFPNSWEDEILSFEIGGRDIQMSLRGRCGGMCFAALDYFRLGERASELHGPELPDSHTPFARYIMGRQVQSHTTGLARNLRRFALEVVSPQRTAAGTGARTRRELGNVLVSMYAGNPVPLGLVTVNRIGIGLNHQIVAYAAQRDAEQLRIRVYDPNLPLRDDVEIVVPWYGEEPIGEYAGGKLRKQWRGLFVERYRPKVPPAVREASAV